MKNLITTVLLLVNVFSYGQDANDQQATRKVEKHLFKVNALLFPSLEYEVGVGDQSTLLFRAGIGGFGYTENSILGTSAYGVYSIVEADYRYYYNFSRRERKGKNTKNNSANYIALSTSFSPGKAIIGDLDRSSDYNVVVGPVWGFQRTYGKRFSIGLDLGLGYGFSNRSSSLAGLGNFRLGWIIGK